MRGPADAPEAVLYLDLACPHCAADWVRIRGLPLRLCVRHFPIASKRPRSPALHAAAESAAQLGGQPAFWSMVDSLFADRAHQDDPHLWQRAEGLGLDLDSFERLRRSEEIAARIRSDFLGGVRAGVVGTPSAFNDAELIADRVVERLAKIAECGGR